MIDYSERQFVWHILHQNKTDKFVKPREPIDFAAYKSKLVLTKSGYDFLEVLRIVVLQKILRFYTPNYKLLTVTLFISAETVQGGQNSEIPRGNSSTDSPEESCICELSSPFSHSIVRI